MPFRSQILLGLTAVGLLPLLLLGLLSYRANRRELLETVGRSEARTAEQTARFAEKSVLLALETLKLQLQQIPFDELSSEESATALQLPYRQLRAVDALVLLDGEGQALAPPLYGIEDEGEAPRAQVGAKELERFAQQIPFAAARESGAAIGAPYRHGAEGAARLSIAVRVSQAPVRVVAAELSLVELETLLRELERGGEKAVFVDAQGTAFAGSPGFTELSSAEREAIKGVLAGGKVASAGIAHRADVAFLTTVAPLPELGWGLWLAHPEADALRPADQVRRYSLFWAGVAVLLIGALGILLSLGLTRPVAQLSEGVKRLAEGEEGAQVELRSNDELGKLAAAFNQMSSEIRRRNEEIRRWNEELQARVDARTAELKAAQAQIDRTRRLSALASMGAGVAHELNNPMTSVIGLVSLVREELPPPDPHHEMLGVVLEQADRITQIVEALRDLTEKEGARSGRRFSLEQPIRAALEAKAAALAEAKIALVTEIPPGLPSIEGNASQLEQLVEHLVSNAIDAMRGGGQLTVRVTTVEGALRLEVKDTGPGIPRALHERVFDPFFTTKQAANRVGLGLSLSHNIVELHHGRIMVESEEGRGATFTVLFPASAGSAHLS